MEWRRPPGRPLRTPEPRRASCGLPVAPSQAQCRTPPPQTTCPPAQPRARVTAFESPTPSRRQPPLRAGCARRSTFLPWLLSGSSPASHLHRLCAGISRRTPGPNRSRCTALCSSFLFVGRRIQGETGAILWKTCWNPGIIVEHTRKTHPNSGTIPGPTRRFAHHLVQSIFDFRFLISDSPQRHRAHRAIQFISLNYHFQDVKETADSRGSSRIRTKG